MLWCWWGGGRASVAVKDDRGSGCAVALLGHRQRYWGMRAVAGVGRWEMEVTINMLLGGACGKARGWGASRPSWPTSETTWAMATHAAMLPFPPSDNKINYNNKDGG
jgi:hypothetical protein